MYHNYKITCVKKTVAGCTHHPTPETEQNKTKTQNTKQNKKSKIATTKLNKPVQFNDFTSWYIISLELQ